jgi:hypothetical protein
MKKGLTFVSGFIVGIVALYAWGQVFNKDEVKTMTEDGAKTEQSTGSEQANATTTDNMSAEGAVMAGEAIVVGQQDAGKVVEVSAVSMAKSGWVVVHEIKSGVVANALGAARREVGEYTDVTVHLLRGTVAGGEYAVVLYEDNGDKSFNLASDVPVTNSNGGFVMQKFNIK